MSSKFVLTSEAARILSVTSDTVRVMERRGELPATRTDTGVRIFDRAAVEALAERRRVAKCPDVPEALAS